MKVCKFEKIKDEDEMKQVINCIQKEHPVSYTHLTLPTN